MPKKESNPDILVLVDVETTGLHAGSDLLLEVGSIVINRDLDVLAQFQMPVWGPLQRGVIDALEEGDFIFDMHTANGLLKECRVEGVIESVADKLWLEWLELNDATGQPLLGSSVGFDRSFVQVDLPKVNEAMHYRNIDISSVKELCRRFNPKVYEKLTGPDGPVKQERHRSISDLFDTINELEWYLDNFMYVDF